MGSGGAPKEPRLLGCVRKAPYAGGQDPSLCLACTVARGIDWLAPFPVGVTARAPGTLNPRAPTPASLFLEPKLR